MKKKILVFTILFFIAAITVCSTAMAASTKFVRAYRDSNYDMYVNRVNIIQNQGVVSFWVKSVYSDQEKLLSEKSSPETPESTHTVWSGLFRVRHKKRQVQYKTCLCICKRKGDLPRRQQEVAADQRWNDSSCVDQ